MNVPDENRGVFSGIKTMCRAIFWRASVVVLGLIVSVGSVGGATGHGVAAGGEALCPRVPKTDFSAKWIWTPASVGYSARNSYAYFRKPFSASGKLTIEIAADNYYQLYLDGQRIGRGTAPAPVAYKTFDTYAVTLDPGAHVLAVLVHHIGEECATAMRSKPGLFVEMVTAAGEKIVSDATWKTLPALAYRQNLPCMMSHFGFYEVCDYRQIPQGWTGPTFDDQTWPNAEVIGPAGVAPWLRMIPRDIPQLATTQIPVRAVVGAGTYQPGATDKNGKEVTIAVEMAARHRAKFAAAVGSWPISLAKANAGEFVVLDFGREVTGHVRLQIGGAKAGQVVDVGYDETLDSQGLPNPHRTYAHLADRFILRDNQTEVEVFGPRGFRYLLVDVAAGQGGVTVKGATIDERTYPVKTTGAFRCSDPRLDRLYAVGLTTTRLCMLDTYVDCPSRERVLWLDLAVEAPCSSYGFGDTALWRRCLYLFAQDTIPTGDSVGGIKAFAISDRSPTLASYTMYYALSVCDYYHHSGDLEACAALFPTIQRQFDILAHYTTPDGLMGDKLPGWGTFLDWSAMDFGGVSSCNNAIYILMHRQMAKLARTLRKSDVARQWEQKAERLEALYRQKFWSPDEKLFVDALYDGKPSPVRSQLANVMPIWAGLVKGGEAQELLLRILDKQKLLPRTPGDYRLKPGFKPQTGGIVQIGTPGSGQLLVQALFEQGMAAEALDYLRENWLPLADSGTYREHFAYDTNTSFCHGWGASAVALLPRYILGIQPVAPGWKEIKIVPQAGGLQWAEGTVPTPLGEIRVSWKLLANGEMDLKYSVPDGMKVTPR
jgi:hypothetical protein